MNKKKHTQAFPIDNLIYQLNSQGINLNPKYQRESVWTLDQKQLLIDSLLHDYDIPKLYFRELDDSEYTYEAVDGQQRLRSIHSFIQGEYSLSENSEPVEIKGMSYEIANKYHKDLNPQIRHKLQSTSLDVVILNSAYTDDDIEDIFLRLQNGTPLNSAEKRRAIAGNFRNVVAELSSDTFFKLSDFKNKRFAFEDICAKLLHITIKGEYTSLSNSSLKKTYEDNKDYNSDSAEFKKLKSAFKFIYESITSKDAVQIKFKKYASITVPLLVIHMMDDYNLKDFKAEFAEALRKFELARALSDENLKNGMDADPKMLLYKNAARADDVASLIMRENILKEFILNELTNLSLKDAKRSFTDDQRNIIYLRDKGICKICNKKCSREDYHADHIQPHSAGGKTSVENGQVLCIECNLKKGNSFIG